MPAGAGDPHPRRTVAVLCTGAAAMFAAMYSTQAIVAEISRDLRASPATVGLTISVVVAAVAAGSWVAGPLSDRIGRKRVMAGSAALLVLPTLGVALAPGMPALLACRAAQGALMPGLLTVAVPYLHERLPPRMLGTAAGAYTAALVLGGLVARLLPASIAEVASWRVGLGAIVPLVLGGAVLLALALPADAPRSGGDARGSAREHLRSTPVLLNALAAGGIGFAYAGVFTYVGFHLAAPPFSLGPGATGLVFTVWVVGITTPALGAWSGRFGPDRAMVVLYVLAAAGLAVASVDRLPTLVAGLAVLALCLYAIITAAQLQLQRLARQGRGAATALHLSIYYAVFALGGYVPGLAYDAAGWHGVLLCAAGALGVGLGSALLARRGAARVAAA